MNDTLEERLLADQLHRIADRAPVPTAPVADDVRRGRGRLRRRRTLVAVGSAAAVVALTAGGVALAGSGTTDERTSEPPVADAPVAGGPEKAVSLDLTLLRRINASLAGNGDDEVAFTIEELRSMTEVLRSRLRGDRVLWFGAGRAVSWDAVGGAECPAGWTCEDVTVKGAPRAAFATSGNVRQLVADFPSGTLVLTFNTVDERPTDLAYRTD